MSRIIWTLVTLCGIVGILAAIAVPSLLRARVSSTPQSAPLYYGNLHDPYADTAVLYNTEDYDPIDDKAFKDARSKPLSTFSIDVDTASYSNVRRFLEMGQRPPKDAVRTEELINNFAYDYLEPSGEHPFSVTTEIGACPWKPEHRLVHIGLQGRDIPDNQLPPRNLVFLIDVSGSMGQPNKLPLLRSAMRLLTKQLDADDRVSLVVYAGGAGLVLPPTPRGDTRTILSAIDTLQPGGSTAGSEGIMLAYDIAMSSFIEDGITASSSPPTATSTSA